MKSFIQFWTIFVAFYFNLNWINKNCYKKVQKSTEMRKFITLEHITDIAHIKLL